MGANHRPPLWPAPWRPEDTTNANTLYPGGPNGPTVRMPPPTLPAPPPAPRHGDTGRTLAIVGGAAVGAALVCCCALLAVTQVAGGALLAVVSGAQATQTAQSLRPPARVGDMFDAGGVDCTLVSAQPIPADLFIKPRAGEVFVLVHLRLANRGTGEARYNTFDFHVKSGAGVITGEDYVYPTTYTANDRLVGGILEPGATVEGDLLFEVPGGDHQAELTWQPNAFAPAAAIAWLLGL
jgi:Domain of unknown function (DUF4352)